MVAVDRQEYMNKASNPLAMPACRPIPNDPTNKIKAKLISILRKVKKETGLEDSTYKYMYPTGCSAPKFYWLPKIQKLDTSLDLSCPVEDLSCMEWIKGLPKYSNLWLVSLHTTSIALMILLNRPTR